MALVKSNLLKVPMLVLITLVVYLGWRAGAEVFYARFLTFGTNIALSAVKKDTSIKVEKEGDTYQFKIRTIIGGRSGAFPQVFGGLMQPFVIILSWQIFLLLALNIKTALRSLWVNMTIFYIVYVVFLIFLTGYHSSEFQKFVYVMMVDSFYIIALVLVIKDNMLYPVFRRVVN